MTNEVEEIKREKDGLDVIDDMPRFATVGMHWVPKYDLTRLKWYGLYHDRPKSGTFMLRLKIPNGILTSQQLRTIGRTSAKYGKDYGKITTRQNIQLHWLWIEDIPDIFRMLNDDGLATTGACGDVMRNVVGCPAAGIDKNEVYDASKLVKEVTRFFVGNKEYSNLPRKYKVSIDGCAVHCALPEIHCVGFSTVRTQTDGHEDIGFTVRVGGGLSSSPHISKPLGVIIHEDDVIDVLRAITDIWRDDPKYRKSRSRARFKFLIDDYGVPKFRTILESKLGRRLEDYDDAAILTNIGTDHMGVHEQKQPGIYYIGVPVLSGRITGSQMISVADVTEKYGNQSIRLTNMQNFIVADIPKQHVEAAGRELTSIGLPPTSSPHKARFIACTALPFCNFAVAETKLLTSELVDQLGQRFGENIAGLRINVTGCPNSCVQHWIADIGLQGTSAKTDKGMVEAFDIALGGSLGQKASIARVIKRRIPASQILFAIENLIDGFLQKKFAFESFKEFCDRNTPEQLAMLLDTAAKSGGT